MGVAVLNPQDCLKQPFSHMKYPRNHTVSCPNRQKKPVSNRTRRSPPRNQTTRSPPKAPPPPPPQRSAVSSYVPKGTVKKSPIAGQVRILKRGEEIPKKTADLVVEKPDLVSTQRIGPDPCLIPSQIRLSDRKSKKATVPPFYAGPVTMASPPPSDVPLPAFFTTTKKSVSLFQAAEATNRLISILGIVVE
ncbi:hypothetical protein Rs2_08304 [Raphanus sativus]|uniref:Uncharacterized protein LOC108843102 n=1 Tax=Raphanus sativus TaxID=3726 RepID=A0A6J0MHU3_RAPSA|nr:uncharacterized protein LOC108843102 [Raphanus sativus]KAJ4913683.1 hypothetical protein Rs2_08304 [Raphanus sativus]